MTIIKHNQDDKMTIHKSTLILTNEWMSGENDKAGFLLINVIDMTEYFLNHCLVSLTTVTISCKNQ